MKQAKQKKTPEQIAEDEAHRRFVKRVQETVNEVGMKRAVMFLRMPQDEIQAVLDTEK